MLRALCTAFLLPFLAYLVPACAKERGALRFEPDRGQIGGQADFVVRGAGYGLWLAAEGPVLLLRDGEAQTVLRWRLVGGRPGRARGEAELPSRSHYLRLDGGTAPSGVPHYRQVRYPDVWPGIDVVYYGTAAGELEYDFVLGPGADPAQISFHVEGAKRLTLGAEGALELHTEVGVLTQRAPVIYQTIDGRRAPVQGRFELDGDTVRFALADYDTASALVIDPVLVWSSYLGGSANDDVQAIAERDGFVYVAGETGSTDFPLQNPLDGSHAGDYDCFVSKMTADGGALVYSTFLGSAGYDVCKGIAVDADGEVYVVGQQGTNAGDAFLAKLSASGSALAYPVVRRQGSDGETANSVVVTAAGVATVAGTTASTDFPTTAGVWQVNDGAGSGAFAFRVNIAGAIAWSTYLDGAGDQYGYAVGIDNADNAYVAGSTYDRHPGGDGFVVKLNASGGGVWNTARVDGSGSDVIVDIDVDPASGEIYVAGSTSSSDLPTTPGVVQGTGGDHDAFVGRFNATGSGFGWLTYLGGPHLQYASALDRDGDGNIYVTGTNTLADRPYSDIFLIKLSPQASAVLYNLQFGGSGHHDHVGALTVAANSDAWIGGSTTNPGLPITADVVDPVFDGSMEGVVMKVGSELATQTLVQNVTVPGTATGANGAVTSPAITLQPGDLVTVEAVGGNVRFSSPEWCTSACLCDATPAGLVWPPFRPRDVFNDNQVLCYNDEALGMDQGCDIHDPLRAPDDAHAGLFRPQQSGIGPAKFIGNSSDTFTFSGTSNATLRLGLNDCQSNNNTGHFNVRVTIVRSGSFSVTVPGNAVAGSEVLAGSLKTGDNVVVSGISGNVNFNTAPTCGAPGAYQTNANGLSRSIYEDPANALCYASDRACVDPLPGASQGHAGLIRKTGTNRSFVGLGGASFTATGNQVLSLGVNDCSGAGSGAPNSGSFTANVRVTRPVPILSVDAPSQAEGNAGTSTMTFTVTLAPASAKTVTVRARTAGFTAVAGEDFVPVDSPLTFTPGQTSKTVSVTIQGDTVIEPDERVSLELINPVNASTVKPRGVGVIVSDDLPTLSVAPATCNEGDTGTSVCNASVTLSAATTQTVTAKVDTLFIGGGANIDDFVPIENRTLTFLPGDPLVQSLPVTLLGDYAIESNEPLRVVLSQPVNATLGSASVSITIANDDAAGTISVQGGTTAHFEQAGTSSLVVFRTGGLAAGAGATYAIQPGTATSPADFSAPGGLSGNVIFAGGETSRNVVFNLVDDALDEEDETFSLVLGAATGGATLGNPTSQRQILDNDAPPALSIDNGGCLVAEGDSGNVPCNLVIRLSERSGRTVTFNTATVTQSATSGSDYTGHGITPRSIAAGQTTLTVPVPVLGDAAVEGDETFGLHVRSVINATPSAGLDAVGTILDDDEAVPGTLRLSQTAYVVDEGAGTVTLTVLRSGGSDGTVSVQYATSNGTASAGIDYTAASGTLSFANGETSRSITVAVTDDGTDENDETFTVTLSNVAGGATLGSPTEAMVTIRDNDAPPSLRIDGGGCSIAEGHSGTTPCTFVLRLTPASARTVNFTTTTTDITATAGSDYVGHVSIPRSIPAGQTTLTVPVAVLGDAVDEPSNETFALDLGAIQNAVGIDLPGAGTILDDDGAPSLSLGDASMMEGDVGTTPMQFTVNLLPASAQTVSVNWITTNGTAIAGSDYDGASGSVSFAPGQTSRPITVPVRSDLLVEADETFAVGLSNAINAQLGDDQGTGTILDDDVPEDGIIFRDGFE